MPPNTPAPTSYRQLTGSGTTPPAAAAQTVLVLTNGGRGVSSVCTRGE